jgi:hypothetical protein
MKNLIDKLSVAAPSDRWPPIELFRLLSRSLRLISVAQGAIQELSKRHSA